MVQKEVNGDAIPSNIQNGIRNSAGGIPLDQRPEVYHWKTTNERGYTINEIPSGRSRPMRVIGVGAGASGICLAKFIQDEAENVELAIYEKNEDVGGTWLENRYPGVACDIPSVIYQYIWEPAVWSKYYSEGKEILKYFKDTALRYGLNKYINLRHRVDHAQWLSEEGKWRVTITDLQSGEIFHDEGEVLVNATGFLNDWFLPNIDGLSKYEGVLAHSANYPQDLSLKNKRVAIVGNGSSGLQMVAKVQADVAHLYTWVRSPTWMTAGFAQKYAGPEGANFEYSERQKDLMRTDPQYYLKYRKDVETEMVSGFRTLHRNTPESKFAIKYAQGQMDKKLENEDKLRDILIPKTFPVGCKRPTPGHGYLEALVQDNVTVFTGSGLERVTSKGVIDPVGKEHEVDVIILATGFNTSWVPRFPIIANGINLQDLYAKPMGRRPTRYTWPPRGVSHGTEYKDKPIGYLGVAAPQIPNYFTFYGPYGPLGQGSAMPMIDLFGRYIIQMIRHIQVEDVKSVTPRQSVIDQYAEHADLFNDRTVWNAPCRSWFKGNKIDGRIMLHPGTRNQYMMLLHRPRLQDYDFEYRSLNMWNWLGNGFSMRDYDGSDLTWYLGTVDEDDKQKEYDVQKFQYSATLNDHDPATAPTQ